MLSHYIFILDTFTENTGGKSYFCVSPVSFDKCRILLFQKYALDLTFLPGGFCVAEDSYKDLLHSPESGIVCGKQLIPIWSYFEMANSKGHLGSGFSLFLSQSMVFEMTSFQKFLH